MTKNHYCPCCNNRLLPEFDSGYDKCINCGYSCKSRNSNDSSIRYEDKSSRNNLPDKYLQKKLTDRMDYLRPLLAPNLSIAEIGCAEGFLGERIKKSITGICYWGVEPSLDAKEAAKRIDNVVSSSTQLLKQCGNNYFDFIMAFHVLEHIENLQIELQVWSKLLKENGLIIVEVPNGSGNALVACDRNPEHVHFFSPAALCSLMHNHSISVASISTGHYESPAYNDCIRATLKQAVSTSKKERALMDRIRSLTGKSFGIIGIGGDFRSYLMPIIQNLPVTSLVDNNSSLAGLEVCGMKVVPYDSRIHHDALMMVSSIRYEDEIIDTLLERKHPAENIIKLSSILNP